MPVSLVFSLPPSLIGTETSNVIIRKFLVRRAIIYILCIQKILANFFQFFYMYVYEFLMIVLQIGKLKSTNIWMPFVTLIYVFFIILEIIRLIDLNYLEFCSKRFNLRVVVLAHRDYRNFIKLFTSTYCIFYFTCRRTLN